VGYQSCFRGLRHLFTRWLWSKCLTSDIHEFRIRRKLPAV